MSQPSPTKLIICDLDSTLFDTPKFIKALPQAVENVFGKQAVQATVFEAQIHSQEFYTAAGYDFVAHLGLYNLELDATSSATLIKSLREQFGSFIYPEVPGFLADIRSRPDTDLAIVTVGVPTCQEFKLRLCSDVLGGIPYEITQVNKGTLLCGYWARGIQRAGVFYDSAVVIDDSADQLLALPKRSDITLVQIYRLHQRHAKSRSARIHKVVGSLTDAL